MKRLKYNGELFAKLEDGSTENLYYGNDKLDPRDFYQEHGEWYLDHDVLTEGGLAYCHSKIVAFLEKNDG